MRYFFLSAIAFFSQVLHAQNSWKAVSPNKSLQIILSNSEGNLSYKVLSGEDPIVKPSALGIERKDQDFTDHLSFVKSEVVRIDERYSLKIGKHKINHALGNETIVTFKNEKNALIEIDLRAYNDGVAFRYRFPGQSKKVIVTNEKTSFVIPDGKMWLETYGMPGNYSPAYEENYLNGIPVGSKAPVKSGWAFPVIFQIDQHWLLLTESNVDRNYFGAHLQQDCSGGIYKIGMPLAEEARGVGDSYATATIPFSTPWRVIIVGKTPGPIVESNLVYDLADPNRIGNTDWIKPGRSSWSWWSDHSSSKDFVKLKKYVDLAKEMGWEYSLVDANWNIMQGGDISQLVKYANEKKVGLALWYNSGGDHNSVTEQPRNIMNDPVKRKEELSKLHRWGIKAIKVDFFQSDKQKIMQLYFDILKDAAKEKIMVIFHGCTLPRGWSRTYPNLISMEGVKGAEQYGWDNSFAQHAPEHNTIISFTRNVVGPMDYTPVTFSDYACCPHVTTNTHELALTVVFESGMLHFADSDSSYLSQSAPVKNFMGHVPNTWDDTKFLLGEPGKEILLARKSGNAWYIAGINGEAHAKHFSIDLSFLNQPSYKAIVFSDGTAPGEIRVTETNHKKGCAASIDVLANGGFVMKLDPIGN